MFSLNNDQVHVDPECQSNVKILVNPHYFAFYFDYELYIE